MAYGVWGFLFMALIWVVLIAGGIWLLARIFPSSGTSRSGTGHNGNSRGEHSDEDTAMQILRRRYARGELTKEEYETMRHDLAS